MGFSRRRGTALICPEIGGIVRADHHCWLSEAQCARLRPLLPTKVRDGPRVDDRRVISGIIHGIGNGLRWRDAPPCYGPSKPLYHRFVRWSKAGVFNRIVAPVASESTASATVMIDPTHLKAHRTAASLLKKGRLRAVSVAPAAGSFDATSEHPLLLTPLTAVESSNSDKT